MDALAYDVEEQQPAESAPLVRMFDITYTDGSRRQVAAHFHEASEHGHLSLIDQVTIGDREVLYYRRTIAAGQWCEIVEITGTSTNATVQ